MPTPTAAALKVAREIDLSMWCHASGKHRMGKEVRADIAHALDTFAAEAVRVERDGITYDDICYLSRMYNATIGGPDTTQWKRINDWLKRQIEIRHPGATNG